MALLTQEVKVRLEAGDDFHKVVIRPVPRFGSDRFRRMMQAELKALRAAHPGKSLSVEVVE